MLNPYAPAHLQWVMSSQPTWWYKTEQFWLSYPQTRMRGDLKAYYLLQFSYWLQQLLVMVLGVEAPRSDYYELVAHVRQLSPRLSSFSLS